MQLSWCCKEPAVYDYAMSPQIACMLNDGGVYGASAPPSSQNKERMRIPKRIGGVFASSAYWSCPNSLSPPRARTRHLCFVKVPSCRPACSRGLPRNRWSGLPPSIRCRAKPANPLTTMKSPIISSSPHPFPAFNFTSQVTTMSSRERLEPLPLIKRLQYTAAAAALQNLVAPPVALIRATHGYFYPSEKQPALTKKYPCRPKLPVGYDVHLKRRDQD